MGIELARVDEIISKHGGDRRALISLLLDVQSEYRYLPREALELVAEKMGLPTIQVYQVARFYQAFSLELRGKHLLSVCLGTACHVQGGPHLLEHTRRLLHIAPGETTEDGQFTLETTNCPGACPTAPMMVVDGTYHSRMAADKIDRILKQYAAAKEAPVDD